ncbi:hypothetical protein VM94_00120 [Janthinobacterium sp. KBS0711]|uniref:YchJ family protein n=1 Tax=Janthinobacterium sp. KBS0711 TaxID=1649647 RepID=UPI000627507D|nr:YchJ family metal-binding protein [Janthinobacterium sp. KBS0711]KKO65783.1 hypothetical protein VM94_00120 [Janthinobacterium sp. KBS0711]TSD69693.1 hypothetical protein FFI39_000930 [Janthinobacterium sp. KBS0711]
MPTLSTSAACPCGGAAYASCCGPYIAGDALPPTAEILMRSRYTAFTLRDEPYLLATWHASTRPTDALFAEEEKVHWLGLEVKSALRLRQRKATSADQAEETNRDSVEFVARYKANGRAHRLHEVSRFVREAGDGGMRWFYLDGSFPE